MSDDEDDVSPEDGAGKTGSGDDDTPDDGRRETHNGDDAQKVALRQKKLPVYSKPKISSLALSPKAKPSGKEFTRAVVTVGCICGTSLLWFETASGLPAFCWTIIKMIREDYDTSRTKYRVDRAVVRRKPDDINSIWSHPGKRDAEGNQKKTLWNMLLNLPESPEQDGEAFRKQWRTLFVKLFNGRKNQAALFGANTLAYDAGDLTPRDKNKKPYLSDYLTIKHTLEVLEYAYSRTKTRTDIVRDDEILGYYFPRDRFQAVREFAASYKRDPEDDGQEGDEDDGLTFDTA